jgi:hypothetical protein
MVPLPSDLSVVWLVLCFLAAWRVTALIVYESGPFDLFTRLRRMAAAIGLARVIACFHCMALWVSLAIVSMVFEWRPRTLLVVLAVAGSASITERWLGGGTADPPEEDSDG